MKKHFELTEEFKVNVFGVKLFRIKSTKRTKHVEVGVLGGFVEKLENLHGNAWVYGDAEVCGNARVYGNARVCGDAEVYGNARVYGDAELKSDNDICWFSKFGSSNRTTTFFKSKENKIKVKCGCFFGNLLEFKQKVKETHEGNKFEKEYLLIVKLAELKLSENA